MDKYRLKEQVEIIRQAFGYIKRFKDDTFVIKIDDSLINNTYLPQLIRDIVLLKENGINIVIVPGAKYRIDEILNNYKIEYETVNNVRITKSSSIQFVKMASFDVANKIMTLLAENGMGAIIGNWVRARAIGVVDGVDYESTGTVDSIDLDKLKVAMSTGVIPIFPNIGWSITGKPYNISSNELAFVIAKNLSASKLFFITNDDAVKVNPTMDCSFADISENGIVSQLSLSDAKKFIQLLPNSSQLSEYLLFAIRACSGKFVDRVHVIGGETDGVILKEIFSNRGVGTMIYSTEHDNIRPIEHKDISVILEIMKPLVETGNLIDRSFEDIERDMDSYYVYEVDGIIHGCGALKIYEDNSAEILAIAIDKIYAKLGIGKKIVEFLMTLGYEKKVERIFLLTTKASDWFYSLGFKDGSVADLPNGKKYNESRKSKVLIFNNFKKFMTKER